MIQIFEPKEYMSVEEAKDRFYPLSFVMTNCKVENYWPVSGYIAAAESAKGEYEELDDYEMHLNKDTSNGDVWLIMTDDPLGEDSVFVEELSV